MVAMNPSYFGARDAMPLDRFVGDARHVVESLFGKSSVEDLPPAARLAIEQQERIHALAARIFAPGTDGEELLEALCDATLRRPVFVTHLGVDPMQALAAGAHREGQNAAIYLLLAWIAQGRGEPQPQREGPHHASTRKPRKSAAPAAGGGRRR